jgi:hypothetical protein
VDSKLTGIPLARARATYGTDPAVAHLGPHLAREGLLLSQFAAAAEADPAAYALTLAAITCAQAGIARPVDRSVLITLACRTDRASTGHLTPDEWEAGWGRCIQPATSAVTSLLRRDDSPQAEPKCSLS